MDDTVTSLVDSLRGTHEPLKQQIKETKITLNREVVLDSRPESTPTKGNFKIRSADVPAIFTNQVLIKTLCLSVDPYMRELMSLEEQFEPPYDIGEVLPGTIIG